MSNMYPYILILSPENISKEGVLHISDGKATFQHYSEDEVVLHNTNVPIIQNNFEISVDIKIDEFVLNFLQDEKWFKVVPHRIGTQNKMIKYEEGEFLEQMQTFDNSSTAVVDFKKWEDELSDVVKVYIDDGKLFIEDEELSIYYDCICSSNNCQEVYVNSKILKTFTDNIVRISVHSEGPLIIENGSTTSYIASIEN